MRLILATMRYETNTFSPLLTPLRAFGPKSGEKAVEIYHGTKNPTAAYIDLAERGGGGRRIRRAPDRQRLTLGPDASRNTKALR